MLLSRFRRSVASLIGLGVAVPAFRIAALGILLTLRIARAVEDDSIRYNSYIAQQVAEAFEQELAERVGNGMLQAESEARTNAPTARILQALDAGTREFRGPHFVPLDDLNNFSMLMVEGQPLLYAPGEGARRKQYFAGLLLRSSSYEVLGAGGW